MGPASTGPAVAANSSVTVDKQQAVANANDEIIITAVVRDAQKKPVQGATVNYRLTGAGRLSEATPTNQQGESIVHLSSTKAETKQLAVSLSIDGTETPLADFTFTFIPGPAAAGVFLTHPTTTRAGQPITPPVTIQVTDKDGNVVSDPFAMSVRLVRSNAGTVQNGASKESVNGVITFANLIINRAQQGYALRAEATNGAADESRTFDVTLGDFSATASTFVATPTVAKADGAASISVTLTAKDLGGNLLSNQQVQLSVSSGVAMLAAASGTTNASGEFSTTVTSTDVGMKTIRATVGAASLDVVVSFIP